MAGLITQVAQIEGEMGEQMLFARLCTMFAMPALAIACVGLCGTVVHGGAAHRRDRHPHGAGGAARLGGLDGATRRPDAGGRGVRHGPAGVAGSIEASSRLCFSESGPATRGCWRVRWRFSWAPRWWLATCRRGKHLA